MSEAVSKTESDDSGSETTVNETSIPKKESQSEQNAERQEGGPSNTDSQNTSQTDGTTIPDSQVTYTPRFKGFVYFFIVLISVGFATFNTTAIAASGVLLTFILSGLFHEPEPPGESLECAYETTPTNPRPAEEVTVTATITNTGSKTVTDIRLIDTIPNDIRVNSGNPRVIGTLRPGDHTTVEYTVTAQRGTYVFGPLTARTRSFFGSMWIQEQLAVADDANNQFTCAVSANDIPLEEHATEFIGRLLGQSGGEGIEFHSTREYHRGDSPSQINWRELAKTGELSTITYREQQAATVTVIADARSVTRVTNQPGNPSLATLTAYAMYQITSTLTSQQHRVGVVAPGVQPSRDAKDASQFPYYHIEHRTGNEQTQRAFALLNAIEQNVSKTNTTQADTLPLRSPGDAGLDTGEFGDSTFDIEPYQLSVTEFARDLTSWASRTTQFVFITPLLDGGAHGLAIQLARIGYPITIVSPDQTQVNTTPQNSSAQEVARPLAQRIAAVQRRIRVQSLQQAGITVIDWDVTERLTASFLRQTPDAKQ